MNKYLLLAFVSFLFVAGCQTTEELSYDFYDLYLTEDGQKFELREVSKAIKIAGLQRGWEITEVQAGELQAFHDNGMHNLTLKILYDADHFDILYVDNKFLETRNGRLDPRYFRWVENLTMDIRAEMLRISD